MKTLVITFGLLIAIYASAQQVSTPDDYEAKENLRELGSTDGTGSVQTFDNRYEGVKGTPYVFEQFREGELFLKSKKKVLIKEMNYNCWDNQIVYKDPAQKGVRQMNRFQVDLFRIHDGTEMITFSPVKLKEDAETIFAQVLYNEGSMVYKVYEKEWVKANYEGGYSADRKYDEFVDKYSLYFMKAGEEKLYKARKSKKHILAAFPEKEKEVSSFIKSNKLDLKKEESLVKLMEYFDSL